MNKNLFAQFIKRKLCPREGHGGGERRNGALALPLVLPFCVLFVCQAHARHTNSAPTHTHTKDSHKHTHICTCARRWLALWRLFKETMNPAAKRDPNKNQKQKRHKKCPTTSEKGNKAHSPLRHFDRSCAACTESKCLVRLLHSLPSFCLPPHCANLCGVH